MVGNPNHRLDEETRHAGGVAVFLSIHYCNSCYCREVLKYAVDIHKFIMPILLDYESDFVGERDATFRLCQASMHMVVFDDAIVQRIVKSIVVNQLDVAREDCVKDDEEGFFPPYVPHGASCEEMPAGDKLALLGEFVDADDPVLYCVVAGAYGTGKRTLCHAFCHEMDRRGWDAIFVNEQRQLEQLKKRPCNDKVAVVNYAGDLIDPIDQCLYTISLQSRAAYLPKVKTDFKTRVILVYQNEQLVDDKCSLPLFFRSKHTNVIKKIRYPGFPYLHLGMPGTAVLKGIMKECAGDVGG